MKYLLRLFLGDKKVLQQFSINNFTNVFSFLIKCNKNNINIAHFLEHDHALVW